MIKRLIDLGQLRGRIAKTRFLLNLDAYLRAVRADQFLLPCCTLQRPGGRCMHERRKKSQRRPDHSHKTAGRLVQANCRTEARPPGRSKAATGRASAQVPNQRRARGADRALQLSRLYCANARTHRSAGRPPVSVRGVPVCCLLEQTRSQKRNACCREKAAASSIITV